MQDSIWNTMNTTEPLTFVDIDPTGFRSHFPSGRACLLISLFYDMCYGSDHPTFSISWQPKQQIHTDTKLVYSSQNGLWFHTANAVLLLESQFVILSYLIQSDVETSINFIGMHDMPLIHLCMLCQGKQHANQTNDHFCCWSQQNRVALNQMTRLNYQRTQFPPLSQGQGESPNNKTKQYKTMD